MFARYILALRPYSCRVWHLLMFETLLAKFLEHPPKAAFKVVAGRFYRVYVRYVLTLAKTRLLAAMFAKSSLHISKSHTLNEHCVFKRQNVSNEHTSPTKRPATTMSEMDSVGVPHSQIFGLKGR